MDRDHCGISLNKNKKLCYCRWTAQHAVSIEILSTAMQLWEQVVQQIEVMELEHCGRRTCNKLCVSGYDASTVIRVISKLHRRQLCIQLFKNFTYKAAASHSSATSQSNSHTVMMSMILLLTLPASSSECLCDSTVSVRLSVYPVDR